MRGKIPWETAGSKGAALTEWEIDPERSALVVIDMQRGYVRPDACLGKVNRRAQSGTQNYYYDRIGRTVLPNILRLQDFFRKHHLEIFYTRLGYQMPEGKDFPEWSWRRKALSNAGGGAAGLLFKGTPEYELVDELKPLPNELVLDKHSLNPFNSTPWEQLLRNMGVENLVVTGVLTNGAVQSTAWSAADRGYNVILVEDACAAYTPAEHESALGDVNFYVTRTADGVMRDFEPLLTKAPPSAG